MRKTRIMKIKPIPIIWVNEKHDTDGDKVPNYRDCNPWNPYQQGWLHDKLKKRKQTDSETDSISKETIDAEGETKQYAYGRHVGPKMYDRYGGYTQKTKWVKIEKPEDANKRFKGMSPERILTSDDPDMLNELRTKELKEHMRARKVQVQDYLDERTPRWKKNLMAGVGLKTKEEKETVQRVKQYQKMIAMERKMGAMPMITHSASDIFGTKPTSTKDKKLFVDEQGRYVDEEGNELFMDQQGRIVDERGNVYDV